MLIEVPPHCVLPDMGGAPLYNHISHFLKKNGLVNSVNNKSPLGILIPQLPLLDIYQKYTKMKCLENRNIHSLFTIGVHKPRAQSEGSHSLPLFCILVLGQIFLQKSRF